MSDKDITDSDTDITDTDTDSDVNSESSEYSTDYSDDESVESIDSKISDRSSCKSKIHTSKNVFKQYKQNRERLVETYFKNDKKDELESLGIFVDEFENLEESVTNVYANDVNNTKLKCVWDSVDFTPIRETFYRESDMIMNPPNVVEGGFDCPRCGSNKTISYAVQRRSADEPMDSFVKCMNIKCMKLSRVN